MNPHFKLTRAKAGRMIGISAALKEYDTYAPFTQFCFYIHESWEGQKWYHNALDVCVQGITLCQLDFMKAREYCVLSAEGDVIFLIPGEFHTERIPETGLHGPYGRMQDIQVIDGQLFACGNGRQVYRREHGGVWRALDPDGRQPPPPRPQDYILLFRINGPAADDVYVAGSAGTLLHWDGTSLSAIDLGLNATLIDVFVESPTRVWVCGSEGTLLVGNRRDGFTRCRGNLGTPLFQGMTQFQGKLYLAASVGPPAGLFTYEEGRLRRVATGLSPEPTHPHIVDAAQGVLWVISIDDIVRFDGTAWERIDDFPESED